MKLYSVIVWILRTFSHLYFTGVRCLHLERIPESGPVILAANHPASVLDAILLAIHTRRQIHFLVRSSLFKNRLLGSLLLAMGAIPVYRAQEEKDYGKRNEAVFDKVYELFERGGCLGLFPEGRNSPVGQVAEIRTGGARMALGAEERNNYRLGLTIVPVGITFEHRELFMSEVLLRFGPVIRVADYAELHRKDPAGAVRQLTDDLQRLMRAQTMHVEDKQVRELAYDLAGVMGYGDFADNSGAGRHEGSGTGRQSLLKRLVWRILDWYTPEVKDASDPLEKRIKNREHLAEVLAKAAADDPAIVSALRRRVDRYRDHLHQTRLTRTEKRSLDEPVRERLIRLRMTVYALVMAPVALFGLVHNIAPYLFTKFTARLAKDEAIRAFAYFGLGFLAFILAYGGFGFWLWYSASMNWKWILVYLALLPPAGFAALRYRRSILLYRDKILVRGLFWNEDELVELLKRERRGIRERFEELAARYER
ncbi:MAG: 1-acyl-sn-glycerol-3-phosphate acyltransferase [Desulfobacterales bacterium]